MAQAGADSIGENVTFPLRLPTNQERGDLLFDALEARPLPRRRARLPARSGGRAVSPMEVLIDLFGSDPVDLHGSMIVNAEGLAQLVLDALAKAGFVIVVSDH
jgi:hypothetical protein